MIFKAPLMMTFVKSGLEVIAPKFGLKIYTLDGVYSSTLQ